MCTVLFHDFIVFFPKERGVIVVGEAMSSLSERNVRVSHKREKVGENKGPNIDIYHSNFTCLSHTSLKV